MLYQTIAFLVLTGGALIGSAAELPDFRLDSRLTLSLFAREPDVVDPVALTWDEEGSMYVVEMRDYPYGFGADRKPGGTVRLLKDIDGDGKADSSTVFATDLSFPTSIAPWNGGVIVAAPPEIVFLKDTNADGKADVREVLLKGFVLGVTDSNMNGLRWGLDNRLHGVNGGNGGNIVSARKPGPPVSIRNLDFSFDPASGDFATTFHTSGGFGLVFDDWGRSFVTYNINHIQQRIIPVRYLDRFPGFPPVQAVESISDHGDMSRIYPISEPETRVNHPEQSGHFSSAGGMGFISSPAFPRDLYGGVLIGDVVGNLVHRDVLSPRGPMFVASRAERDKEAEFFASRDRACRPVGVEFGPDGALYLIDMQRDVIEHPDYIPQPVRDKMNLRAGEDRGRIYRITPNDGLPRRKSNLRQASGGDLVQLLSDSDSWWRFTAQRLLVERRHQPGWTNDVVPALRRMAEGKVSMGRLHALWTLRGLAALDEALVVRALADPEPGLRENALILSEAHLARSQELQKRVIATADDPDARVRFQAALSMGGINDAATVEQLTKIALRDANYRWSRLAVISSLSRDEEKVFQAVANYGGRATNEGMLALVRELADLVGARPAVASPALANIVKTVGTLSENFRVAALEGLQSGLARNNSKPSGSTAIASALSRLGDSPATLTASWQLSKTLGLPTSDAQRAALAQALLRARDASLSITTRVDAIRVIGLGDYSATHETLFALLDGRQPAEVQSAAIDAVRQFDNIDVARKLIERWTSLAPAVRSPVINLLLQRLAFHEVLVDAMERGKLTVGELNLDLEQRRRLLWESTSDLKRRAATLIGDGEYANRKTVVDDWLKRLPAHGDPARGRGVFEKACAQCHALAGTGHNVGPDLAALAHRSVEDLLSNILDPNMAINPTYVGYNVETVNGEIESGILQSESADAIQLLQASGRKVVVPRKQIKRLESSGLSLMPEGLEAGLTPADLRDVISLLQQKR